jgi:Flp pilus assembly protein TadG
MFKPLIKRKKGQAMVEMVCVLGLYLFLIGFMITGFQLMYNKMVYSMAAYEGVRTAIAYNPSTSSYNIAEAKARAQDIIKNQIGDTKGPVKVDIVPKGDYFECTVEADVKFLFPIINPDGIGSKNENKISTTFTMRKERP